MHRGFRVPRPGSRALGQDLVDPIHVLLGEPDVECADILFQVNSSLRPGDGDNVVALRGHPGECQLARSALLFRSNLPYALYQPEILLEIFPLKARIIPSKIISR
jgi:hypothetical protein